eukprot:GEZU01019418.1.p1 GENE.GEZU01019418.1~~GEZU01019418.1.p1  ORF type:complete len:585 (-),score=173.85 GEZU01019418.1:826-2580(-)
MHWEAKTMAEEAQSQIPNEHIIRILVASDNHLGIHERDRVRRDDSFVAFEEILKIAQEHEVDMVLLGGNIFHENKPSRYTTHRVMQLFRKYCFGNRSISLQIHSDQREFRNPFGTVNYEDPNFNISLPVFAIHGCNDDPTGENGLSAIDLLSISNMLNYFGRHENMDDIHVKPILISKGETKLALYGVGWIRDERLYKAFQQKKVKFYRPKEYKDEWFNIFMLHQTRGTPSRRNAITEGMLKGFFDIVIWGHETECRAMPEKSEEGGFDVMQPGASVVTDLTPEESTPKKVAILEIYKDNYRCIPVPLKTSRPFIMDEINLADYEEEFDKNDVAQLTDFLVTRVEELIEKAENEVEKNSVPDEVLSKYPSMKLPLVRLKINYKEGNPINPQRFGQRFVDRVANPGSIIAFSKQKSASKKKSAAAGTSGEAVVDEEAQVMERMKVDLSDTTRIEDLVADNLKEGLGLLNEVHLAEAVNAYVQKEEIHAIAEFVEEELAKTQKKLWREVKQPNKDIHADDVVELVTKYHDEEVAKSNKQMLRFTKLEKMVTGEDGEENYNNEDDDFPPELANNKKIGALLLTPKRP